MGTISFTAMANRNGELIKISGSAENLTQVGEVITSTLTLGTETNARKTGTRIGRCFDKPDSFVDRLAQEPSKVELGK